MWDADSTEKRVPRYGIVSGKQKRTLILTSQERTLILTSQGSCVYMKETVVGTLSDGSQGSLLLIIPSSKRTSY